MKILFASSEVYPLIKTGGLADVSGSLPVAFAELGHDVRIVMPGYQQAMRLAEDVQSISAFSTALGIVEILQGKLPGTTVPVWMVNAPEYFARDGNPYLNDDGHLWEDSAERFGQFCFAIVEIAQNRAGLEWQPEIVHCNDWQTGLVPALLNAEPRRPVTVFTIHNLAYQGVFPYSSFIDLGLPNNLWSIDGLEFYGQMSFMKGGLSFADQITTVSPNYASEIQTEEYGYGLNGLLSHRSDVLSGIINGIDQQEWNSATDSHLVKNYSQDSLALKIENKRSLQDTYDIERIDDKPLIGMIGRIVEQKGIDLVIDAIRDLLALDIQLVILGTGSTEYEQQLSQLATEFPRHIGVKIGFSERLAHQIEAGADIFLMPSRFEPCGLNQMYSLRYGTLPVVRLTGGLADTVVDATPENILAGTATGFVFMEASADALSTAIERAVALYQQKSRWNRLQITAMQQDYSWQKSASRYIDLFEDTHASHTIRPHSK